MKKLKKNIKLNSVILSIAELAMILIVVFFIKASVYNDCKIYLHEMIIILLLSKTCYSKNKNNSIINLIDKILEEEYYSD